MNIVYALTRNVYEQLLPSITSLVKHNKNAKIFIVCEDDKFPYELPKKCTVINISGQTWFEKDSVNYNNPYSYINLLKVCYPTLLNCDKVIHLDIDTIICGSLKGLWDTDVKGKWFAACPEYKGWYKPFGDVYYNMGVALINLAQMRKDKAQDRLVEYLNGFCQPWADQDAWNEIAIQEDKATTFELKYNENFATGKTDEPVIVHYCGVNDWYTNRNMFRREYLDEYLSER